MRFKALVRGEVSIWHCLVLMVEGDKAFFYLGGCRDRNARLSLDKSCEAVKLAAERLTRPEFRYNTDPASFHKRVVRLR